MTQILYFFWDGFSESVAAAPTGTYLLGLVTSEPALRGRITLLPALEGTVDTSPALKGHIGLNPGET